jgi:hypothetical protein
VVISGTITCPNLGSGVQATVTLTPYGTSAVTQTAYATPTSATTSTYQFGNVPAGTYTISATYSVYTGSYPGTVSVSASMVSTSTPLPNCNITLTQGQTVSGNVTTDGATPAYGATVYLLTSSATPASTGNTNVSNYYTFTGSNYTYSLSVPVNTGTTYYLMAYYNGQYSQAYLVTSGMTSQNLSISSGAINGTATYVVSGTVTSVSALGGSVTWATVTFQGNNITTSATTNTSGGYTLPAQLPTGTYTVTVTASNISSVPNFYYQGTVYVSGTGASGTSFIANISK